MMQKILLGKEEKAVKKSLVLSLVLGALLLVTVMAVSVSAAPSLQMGEVTVTKDVANNLVTFTVPYTAENVSQITILAMKSTKDTEPVATEENIVYINQQSSEAGDSFVFAVPYDKFSADLPYCWIKIGGTSIATAQGPEDMEIWTPAVSTLVYGDVNGDNNVDATDVVLVTKYAAATAAEEELDATEFPGGTFSVGSAIPADVNADGNVDATDVVLITKYAAATAAEEELDATEFPGGKFPAASN